MEAVMRFILRNGRSIAADISAKGLEVYAYKDRLGDNVHALASKTAEKDFLRRLTSHLIEVNELPSKQKAHTRKPPTEGEVVSHSHA